MRQIQAQQDELNRKLNEKISDDLNKFQKAMDDIFKQKQVSQQKYFIQKIKEEQEQASFSSHAIYEFINLLTG